MRTAGDGFEHGPENYFLKLPILTKGMVLTHFVRLTSSDPDQRTWYYNNGRLDRRARETDIEITETGVTRFSDFIRSSCALSTSTSLNRMPLIDSEMVARACFLRLLRVAANEKNELGNSQTPANRIREVI
jgi:hypothetical protein